MASGLILRSKDNLQELSMKLEQCHLAYLQTDDSPLKLRQRQRLEVFIKEYLCLVPNDNKYIFQETADILHRSAATLQDFSGYRAVNAWSAISLYAANLLAQPWRKEYRTLRTYSGYYKHEVEANLIGAELMFEQMGYKHTSLGILNLDGPIDPDKVSSVSRDAIVACVECQILKQIWESVSQNYTVAWLEILEFRENHVGTPEQAIRALNYRFLEKMHQNSTKADNYRDYYYIQPTGLDAGTSPVSYQINSSNYNTTVPPSQVDPKYIEDPNMITGHFRYFHRLHNGLGNRYGPYNCMPPGNRYFAEIHTNPYCTIMPGCTPRVPTGQLIELDAPVSVANYEKSYSHKQSQSISDFDEVDSYRRQLSDGEHYDYNRMETKPQKADYMLEKNSTDTWDFVYKNLEGQGYSKDLGDRENILHKKEVDTRVIKQKPAKLLNDCKYNTQRFEQKKSGQSDMNKVDPSSVNGRNLQHETMPFKKKKSSSFDLSDSHKHNSSNIGDQLISHSKDKKHSSQTLPIQHTQHSAEQLTQIADSIENLDVSSDLKSKVFNNSTNRWNCATCTFLNMPKREICEMCGKSRHKGNEDKPLASGGQECPKCTLINEKNVSTCEACEANLKYSSTYI